MVQDIQNAFVKYSELTKNLFEFYQFGYLSSQQTASKLENETLWGKYPSNFNRFEQDFDKHIIKRLESVFGSTKYVNIEYSYVETEWKDMIALHYINTTYAAKLLPRTIRIHFLADNEYSNQNYLGFITLRPIEELQIALSYIFVNWDSIQKDTSSKYKFVGYAKKIHCLGKELCIQTYPVLTQDTIVTCCADVNIITLSRFLAHKFGGKKLEIRDICKDDYNVVYPRRITAERFVELCSTMHIPFKTQHINLHSLKYTSPSESGKRQNISFPRINDQDSIKRYIDVYLDSNLPVVIFVDGHVIQLVGYKSSDQGKEYIVLDDSGFMDPEGKKRFCYFIAFDTFFSQSFENERENLELSSVECHDSGTDGLEIIEEFYNYLQNNIVTIGIPQSERVYIDYNYYEILLNNMIKQLWSETSEQHRWFLDADKNFLPGVKTKSRLVECTQFIKYLYENINIAQDYKKEMPPEGLASTGEGISRVIENLSSAIRILHRTPLPHYLWYTELTNADGILIGLCADPTRFYKDTSHLDKVFYNCLFDDDKRGIAIIKSMWDE